MSGLDPKLKQDIFAIDNLRQELETLNMKTSSPSRMLGDLFWKHLNWESIESEVDTLHMSDFGCGDGHYGELFYEFSGERLQQYHGYDLFKNDRWEDFEQQNAYMTFQLFDSSVQPKLLSSFSIKRIDDVIAT